MATRPQIKQFFGFIVLLSLPLVGGGALATPAKAASQSAIVTAKEYSFSPKRIDARVGTTLRITLVNKGTITHNFAIKGLGAQTKTISPGKSATITVVLSEAGTFKYECKVPGHAMVGMVGKLIVTPK